LLELIEQPVHFLHLNPEHPESRAVIKPGKYKYLFIYPFLKTREWYLLPLEQRQTMMDEHIRIGNKYPSVKLNTTYSFGIDDQEFVVAFETDQPGDFLDLVMELRESQGSRFTLRDTPIFTAVLKSQDQLLTEF
jgi:chlorite dismutase